MSARAVRRPGVPSGVPAGAAIALGAAALGTSYGYTASAFHPLALPALLALGLLVVVSFSRPEIALAAAFPFAVIGHVVPTPGPQWLPGAAWAAFVLALAVLVTAPSGRVQLPRLGLVVLIYLGAALFAVIGTDGELGDAVPLLRSIFTGLMLFFAIALVVRTRQQAETVLTGAVAGGALVGLFAIYQSRVGATSSVGFITSSGELVERVTGGFGHPNALGGFLALVAPFALGGLMLRPRWRLLFACALLAILGGIYVSYSRGALLGVAIIPLFFLRGRTAVILLPFLGAVAAFATPTLLRERFGTLTAQGSEIATRLDIWKTAITIWLDHPAVGAGLGRFDEAYAQARIPGKQFLPSSIFEPPPHAHNVFLQALAEQGLVGLVALGAVLLTAGYTALLLRSRAEEWVRWFGAASLASLTAFFIHNQFDVTLIETTGIYFWGLLGLLSALASIALPGRDERVAAPELRLARVLRPFGRKQSLEPGGAAAPPREADLAWRERRLAEWQRELAEREQSLSGGPPPDEDREKATERESAQARELAAREEELARRQDALQRRVAAITARERALARRAAELSLREVTPVRAEPEPEAAPAVEPEPSAEPAIAPAPGRAGLPTLDELDHLVAANPDPDRSDEWRYTLLYLREYADYEGRLPAEFDGLVADVFGELL